MAVIDGKWLSKEGLTYFWSKIKAIFTKQTETNVIANLGAKNLLLVTGTTSTVKAVTYTVNDDGTITANGQASANADWNVNSSFHLEPGTYKLTGCPAGGNNSSTYKLQIQGIGYDTGDGLTFTVASATNVNVHIRVWSGYNANNLVFKPMIRPAEITDNTFEPYAPTNRELYETEQPSYDFIFGLGTALQSNDDLNNYNKVGKIYAATGAIAATISNTPWTLSGFMVITIPHITAKTFIQFLLPNTVGGKWYKRKYTAGAWAPWTEYDETQEVFASKTILPNDVDLNDIKTGGIYNGVTSTGNSASNMPVPNGSFCFNLIVLETNEFIMQIFKKLNSEGDLSFYIRRLYIYNTSWDAWTMVSTDTMRTGKSLASGDDMDNLPIGRFTVLNASVAAGVAHAPWPGSGFFGWTLESIRKDDRFIQVAIRNDGALVIAKRRYAGTWSDWVYSGNTLFTIPGSILDYAASLPVGVYHAMQEATTGTGKPVEGKRYTYIIHNVSASVADILAIDNSDRAVGSMYTCVRTGSTWGPWFKYEGTQV